VVDLAGFLPVFSLHVNIRTLLIRPIYHVLVHLMEILTVNTRVQRLCIKFLFETFYVDFIHGATGLLTLPHYSHGDGNSGVKWGEILREGTAMCWVLTRYF